MMDKLRTNCVSVRFNDDELELLNDRRNGMEKGRYLRQLFLGETPSLIPPVNLGAYADLARSASNLNQLVRKFNYDGDIDLGDLMEELHEFRLSLIGAKLKDGEE